MYKSILEHLSKNIKQSKIYINSIKLKKAKCIEIIIEQYKSKK